MKKETVKSCLLGLLVFICVFLFYKIWIGGKLWSSDYNFFAVLWGEKPAVTDTTSSIEDILLPRRIIFSGGGKRFVSTKGEENFETYYNDVKSVLTKISVKTTFTSATEDEMLSAAKSSSVIVDFGTVFGGEIGTFLGTYFPCESVKDVVISYSDSALGKPVVFVRNQSDGKIFKTAVDLPLDTQLATLNSHLEKNSDGNIPFAFELRFNQSDISSDSEITQNILLDANILINLNEVSAPGISITPPQSADLSAAKAGPLLTQFGISRSTAKKYIETNDSVLYVGGGSTLKISPSGRLEFTSDPENGPVIYDPSAENALPTAIGNIFSCVRAAFRAYDLSSPALQISSDLVNFSNNSEEITINIEYYLDSTPVMVWEDSHAITVTLKNGRLVSYSQQLCDISKTDHKLTAGNMLQAVDSLYSILPISGGEIVNVSDIFVAYTDENSISWCAKISGNDDLIVIGRKEDTP